QAMGGLEGKETQYCRQQLHAPLNHAHQHISGRNPQPGFPAVVILGSMPRVYMGFMQRDGWHVYFMLPDLQTHLPRKLTFSDSQKIVEMAQRGGMDAGLETKTALEHG